LHKPGGILRRLIFPLLIFGFLICGEMLKAGSPFFPKEFNGMVSIQSLPAAQCTLKEFYFTDTTRSANAGFIPVTASIGMDFAFFYGYAHSLPKLIFETSIGGDGERFWGFGGALALEAHPLRDAKYDPYLFVNFGYINMPGGGYDGHGYHLDVGGGFVFPMKSALKVTPFIAYTPVSQWMRRKQVGYVLVDPIIGPEPAYEGRLCRHSGLRFGISVLFNIFGE
jgi:hypothetical protein